RWWGGNKRVWGGPREARATPVPTGSGPEAERPTHAATSRLAAPSASLRDEWVEIDDQLGCMAAGAASHAIARGRCWSLPPRPRAADASERAWRSLRRAWASAKRAPRPPAPPIPRAPRAEGRSGPPWARRATHGPTA